MRHMATGAPVCVTVTLLNGLVYSRTALNHSMNYRSAVCFGRGRRVMDPAVQSTVYDAMVSRYFPESHRGPGLLRAHGGAPGVHYADRSGVEEWSAKMRTGGPLGPLDAVEDAAGTCACGAAVEWAGQSRPRTRIPAGPAG